MTSASERLFRLSEQAIVRGFIKQVGGQGNKQHGNIVVDNVRDDGET